MALLHLLQFWRYRGKSGLGAFYPPPAPAAGIRVKSVGVVGIRAVIRLCVVCTSTPKKRVTWHNTYLTCLVWTWRSSRCHCLASVTRWNVNVTLSVSLLLTTKSRKSSAVMRTIVELSRTIILSVLSAYTSIFAERVFVSFYEYCCDVHVCLVLPPQCSYVVTNSTCNLSCVV